MLKFFNSTLLFLYCGLIFYLSNQPALPTPMLFPHQDKIFHMTAYYIMAVSAWRFFNCHNNSSANYIWAVIFTSIYGISDEWHQYFVPGRSADVYDWIADTIGAIIAVSNIYLLKLLTHRMTSMKQDKIKYH